MTAAEQRRLLGLPAHDLRPLPNGSERSRARRTRASGSLATELAARLGCAVLAMRYPVGDEFAIALSGKLYDLLAGRGSRCRAPSGWRCGTRVGPDDAEPGGTAFPALSLATPALFGGGRRGPAARRPGSRPAGRLDDAAPKMAGFPPQPDRFVGRTGVMARASAALAAESGIPGVLLHGMPGGGKTACALELAYGHEHAFDRLVWYKAPDEGMDITGALTDFALDAGALPGRLPDGPRARRRRTLAGFLPRLTELMEQRRLLIVIDNAESLLTEDGQWRDDRWGQVIGALTAHAGLGRVILTSRRCPPDSSGLRVEAVDALSADEALLLARELPHLRRPQPTARSPASNTTWPAGSPAARWTSPRATRSCWNSPTARPRTRTARRARGGGRPGMAEARRPAGRVLRHRGDGRVRRATTRTCSPTWTKTVTGTLARRRAGPVLVPVLPGRTRPRAAHRRSMWPSLWDALGRDGQPPGLDQALPALAARGLGAITDGSR